MLWQLDDPVHEIKHDPDPHSIVEGSSSPLHELSPIQLMLRLTELVPSMDTSEQADSPIQLMVHD